MECEKEVVGLYAWVVSFQLMHRFNYFINSNNCYHRAYDIKYSPDYLAPKGDWIITSISVKLLRLILN
jgi:hypothetical protein